MKAIVYSLFRGNDPNSFSFNSYLQGFMVALRTDILLYPDWTIVLETDYPTAAEFGAFFAKLPIVVEVNEPAALCKAMLWRMKPVFNRAYSHVICRDTDSPATWRERQCVEYWVRSEKAAHAITDSISHTIPLMGGMIGFRPGAFHDYTGMERWEQLFEGVSYDWNVKGTDQTLLNNKVYPFFAQPGRDSITQHYIKGMPNTFLSDWHNEVPDMGVANEYKESDEICGHCGSSGYYNHITFRFLQKHKHKFTQLLEAEKMYPNIFYWTADGTF